MATEIAKRLGTAQVTPGR